MQNKQAYIDFIIDELNKGNIKYNDVCLLFCTKFDVTKQTFNKFWKQANDKYSEQRQSVEAAKMEQIITTEREAVKRDIMGVMEAKEILSKMARGTGRSLNGQIFYPSETERTRAIDLLSKMNGWNAPTEVEAKVDMTHDKELAEKLMNMVYNPVTRKFESA